MKMFSLLLKIKLRLFYKLQKMGGKKKKSNNKNPTMRVLRLSKESLAEMFFSE